MFKNKKITKKESEYKMLDKQLNTMQQVLETIQLKMK